MSTADNYTAGSGQTIYGGRSAGGSLVDDTWTTIPGAVDFVTWANANIPAGAYGGTNPFPAIVNAFGDPAIDPDTGDMYFHCGGHGDSTCGAVIKWSRSTRTFSLAFSPTPPAKYPPLYGAPATGVLRDLTYPSGATGHGGVVDTAGNHSGGHFRSDLTDPADTAYNTTYARVASHMYGAAVIRKSAAKPLGVIHYFYNTYAEFDIATSTWVNMGQPAFTLATQLITFRAQYNAYELQQGTMAVHDSATDRFFVTLVPGDSGGGWRSGIMVIRAGTTFGDMPVIESIIESTDADYGLILESVDLRPVGRKIYVFTKPAANRYLMNGGIIFDMDTHAMQKFTLIGDTAGSDFTGNSTAQECIPSWYDGVAIRRFNYAPSQKGFIYSVAITPESGTGTTGDPFMLRQTVRSTSGAIPNASAYAYHRAVWNAAGGYVELHPNATTIPVQLKLS